jgi:CBS domain containing-hemolysin-like protein
MELLIFYVALALVVSFLCSIMEAVLLSVTPSFVAERLKHPDPTGKRLAEFKENIDRPLAAILTLNTIAHTIGAAGAGAQAVKVFGEAWMGAFAVVLTLMILFLSEIIPKTLGAVYWRELTPAVTVLLGITVVINYPLVLVGQGLTRLLTPKERRGHVSRSELAALTELGVTEGVIEEHESVMLKNLLQFSSVQVSDVMTPRVVMQVLPDNHPIGETPDHEAMHFSRIPIHDRDDPDSISGHVLKDDILLSLARDEHDTPLSALRRDLTVVPLTVTLPVLFEQMLERSEHIALVVDEYGDIKGLVTMEDMIETLLGREIVDEADSVEDMRGLAQQHSEDRAQQLGMAGRTEDSPSSSTQPDQQQDQGGQ